MDVMRQREEVDRNYDAFLRVLGSMLAEHRDKFALMRNCEVVGVFAAPGDAHRAGIAAYEDGIFSIQEITDEPIDLGFWSHVATH